MLGSKNRDPMLSLSLSLVGLLSSAENELTLCNQMGFPRTFLDAWEIVGEDAVNAVNEFLRDN